MSSAFIKLLHVYTASATTSHIALVSDSSGCIPVKGKNWYFKLLNATDFSKSWEIIVNLVPSF